MLSIIIPTYKRAEMLAEALDSALSQTLSDIEVIVADNASNDGTRELVLDYQIKDSRVRLLEQDRNVGPVRNWKAGLSEAKGKYVALLFSDDLWHADFAKTAVEALEANIDAAFVFGRQIILHADLKDHEELIDNADSPLEVIESRKYVFDKIFARRAYPNSPCCAVFRRDDVADCLLESIENPYSLDLNQFGAGSDLLFFLRAAERHGSIVYASGAVVYFRGHDKSFSSEYRLKCFYDYSKYWHLKSHDRVLCASVIWLYFYVIHIVMKGLVFCPSKLGESFNR